MTDEDELGWKIDTVRESIRLDWENLASKSLIPDERKAIREHLEICTSDLKDLPLLMMAGAVALGPMAMAQGTNRLLKKVWLDRISGLRWFFGLVGFSFDVPSPGPQDGRRSCGQQLR